MANPNQQAALDAMKRLESEVAQIQARQIVDAARLVILDAQIAALQPIAEPPVQTGP